MATEPLLITENIVIVYANPAASPARRVRKRQGGEAGEKVVGWGELDVR